MGECDDDTPRGQNTPKWPETSQIQSLRTSGEHPRNVWRQSSEARERPQKTWWSGGVSLSVDFPRLFAPLFPSLRSVRGFEFQNKPSGRSGPFWVVGGGVWGGVCIVSIEEGGGVAFGDVDGVDGGGWVCVCRECVRARVVSLCEVRYRAARKVTEQRGSGRRSLPAVVLDHVRQLDDELALFVFLTALERMLVFPAQSGFTVFTVDVCHSV